MDSYDIQSYLRYLLVIMAYINTMDLCTAEKRWLHRVHVEQNNVSWCNGNHLQFVKNQSQKIGLISFPKSGNTWLRYLVQKATGYITGSFYFSDILYENGFPGEYIYNESAILIKSHLQSS